MSEAADSFPIWVRRSERMSDAARMYELTQRAMAGDAARQALNEMLAERTALRQQVADLTAERDQAARALRAIELKTGDYPNDRVAVLRQHLYEIELIARSPEIAVGDER